MTHIEAEKSARRIRPHPLGRLAGKLFVAAVMLGALLLAFGDLPEGLRQKVVILIWTHVLLNLFVHGATSVGLLAYGLVVRFSAGDVAGALGRGLRMRPARLAFEAILAFALYWDGRMLLLALFLLAFAIKVFLGTQPNNPLEDENG